jgi:hypothetical protein
VLTTPCVLQEVVTVPPGLDVATDKSYDGEIRVKVPPVDDESVTATLVAFTCSASAAEPVAIVRVVAGEIIEIDSAVAKFKDAANTICAAKTIRMIPRIKNNNDRCFVNEFGMDTEVERAVL